MKRLILLSLAGLAAAMAARAEIIYVQGDVSGTWAADTVMVTGEVRVPPGMTLVIQPGVSVIFQVYCKFIVDSNATLSAIGTETDSIRFTTVLDTGRWCGIRMLQADDSSRIEYCIFMNGWASGSGQDANGGALYCFSSDPFIQHNLIRRNSAVKGGGIYCDNSNPMISSNWIQSNDAEERGGGICCWGSSPDIIGNAIVGNSAGTEGGGIHCYMSSPSIISNRISGNSGGVRGGGISCLYSNPDIRSDVIFENASSSGGGISCYNSNPNIGGNVINANTAAVGGGISCSYSSPATSDNIISVNMAVGGGGIDCFASSPNIIGNRICGNTANAEGGGIRCAYSSHPDLDLNVISENHVIDGHGGGLFATEYSNPPNQVLDRGTFYGNSAADPGGAIYIQSSTIVLNNTILRANRAPSGAQIYQLGTALATVTYSDIEGGWPGLGNINLNAALVDTAHDDYRLLWDSPCIDSGDPNPIYNDPDGTRADMGAFYYDQSVMVRILLTPHEIPYLIPETGGSMDYTIRAFNRDSLTHAATVWCDVTLPDSSVYGPVLGPVTVTLGAGALLERVRTQDVPAVAPMGVYYYNAYAVVGADTSKDNFMWGKLGAGGLGLGASNWTNTGEPITDVGVSAQKGARSAPRQVTEYRLHSCSPNPFNAETAIGYKLQAASRVSLRIYDTAGRYVITLVDGWREAGSHEITFDGSDLSSGIYICRLQAGEFEGTQKMVLLK